MSRPSTYCPCTDPQLEERRGGRSAPGCSGLLWEGAGLLTLVQGLLALASCFVCHCFPLSSLPGAQFMPDLTSNPECCCCCSSSWVPVGKCFLAPWRGSKRGHTGSPSSVPQGSWKAHFWWMLWPFYGTVHCVCWVGLCVFDFL